MSFRRGKDITKSRRCITVLNSETCISRVLPIKCRKYQCWAWLYKLSLPLYAPAGNMMGSQNCVVGSIALCRAWNGFSLSLWEVQLFLGQLLGSLAWYSGSRTSQCLSKALGTWVPHKHSPHFLARRKAPLPWHSQGGGRCQGLSSCTLWCEVPHQGPGHLQHLDS